MSGARTLAYPRASTVVEYRVLRGVTTRGRRVDVHPTVRASNARGRHSANFLCTVAQPTNTTPSPCRAVPELSRFLGIVVRMYYRDHSPPHFHVRYGRYVAIVEIETGVVQGRFPPRALRHVLEWRELHVKALREAWNLAQSHRPLEAIAPLE